MASAQLLEMMKVVFVWRNVKVTKIVVVKRNVVQMDVDTHAGVLIDEVNNIDLKNKMKVTNYVII